MAAYFGLVEEVHFSVWILLQGIATITVQYLKHIQLLVPTNAHKIPEGIKKMESIKGPGEKVAQYNHMYMCIPDMQEFIHHTHTLYMCAYITMDVQYCVHHFYIYSTVYITIHVCVDINKISIHISTWKYIHVCVMVQGRKLGGSKSTAGLHSQCSPATLM